MLVLDPDSATPPYEQVRTQVAALVHGGELVPGTRLPAVRRLAGDLGLAPNTVARAYRELESGGIVEARGRQGTFVAHRDDTSVEAAEAAAGYAERIRGLGIPPGQALGLAADALGMAWSPVTDGPREA